VELVPDTSALLQDIMSSSDCSNFPSLPSPKLLHSVCRLLWCCNLTCCANFWKVLLLVYVYATSLHWRNAQSYCLHHFRAILQKLIST